MAQAARLNLRMQKEVKLLLTDPPPGASFPHLFPSSDLSSFSLTAIDAQIEGPEGTVYEKGVFKIKIQIPERYPFQPPAVTFGTPIYHPNIDTGGRICLDILNLPPKGAWQPSLNISTVLTSIGLLLSEPNPDDGLMCEASREYKYNKQVFDQKARYMTEKYARSDASSNHGGLPSVTDSIMREDKPPEPVKTDLFEHAVNFKKVSDTSRKLSLDTSCSGSSTREGDKPFDGKVHILTAFNSDHDQYNKPPEVVKTDLYEHAASFKKFSGTGKNLSLDASFSGSNSRESHNGMNGIAQNTLSHSSIQDLKYMPIVGKDHVSKVIKSDHDRDNKPPELVKSDWYEHVKKILGTGGKLSLDTSCSGSNPKESNSGMNEIASNILCHSQIQELKQDSKDMPIVGKDHVLTEKSDCDRDNKPPELVKTDMYTHAASIKKVSGTGRKLSLNDSYSGSNTKESGKGMNAIASNTSCQSHIQELKHDSKDMSFDGKDHVSTVIKSDHDQYDKPPAISSKKLCLSSKNLQNEILDSTRVCDLDAQKNLLQVQKKSTDGNGSTNPKHWTGRKLSLDTSCSGSNTRENTLRQSHIQEPKRDIKEISVNDEYHILTVINSDHDHIHDQDNKPLAISSKKLCISSRSLQKETLDPTMVCDLDAQKENLLKVQKKSTDGNGLTNPKRKRLGLTGMKPYSEFLGKPQNKKFDGTVKAVEKGAISTSVLKLPRKPLQVLEAKHNANTSLRVNAEMLDTNVSKNEESLEQEEMCESEEVIVLDSEDSEEEKPNARNSRRLIARKRVFGKC